ncbi:MAG: Rieske 2Fe-2S domain-containing protein [Pseudomonadales bacterium]|nr:Rieske 2Fe-2S domain-containing protein [Pseudomonadales bacterium]
MHKSSGLSDASPAALEQLVDWQKGTVSGHIFVDESIYEKEAEQVFLRSWLYLGHESQIMHHGDFISTYMGADSILVVRQRDGTVKGLLNACRHRGMGVCRADSGNASTFVCPFHGWTYDTAGELRSVPLLKSGYEDKLDKSQWGLMPVPRVEIYKGLIFGCFDLDAPSLLEYLGDMAWYLDCLLDRTEGGTEVIGGAHKMRINGNWKLAAEQFAGDNYHTVMTHASVPGAWSDPDKPMPEFVDLMEQFGKQFVSREGHSVAGFTVNTANQLRSGIATFSKDVDIVLEYYRQSRKQVANRLGEERANGPATGAGNVFPNFTYLNMVMGASSIGVVHPHGPNQFDWWRWGIVDKSASKEVKAAMVRCLHTWPLGMADADDGENWGAIQTSIKGPLARKLMFNYQLGMGQEGADDQYPGRVYPGMVSELPQRYFYRRWLEYMTSESWPDINDT